MLTTQTQVVAAEEYLPARLRLLQKEKELTRAHDALIRERQSLPVVSITKAYTFTAIDSATGGPTIMTLADLFNGRDQLIIYHFMFDPVWDAGCPSCTLLADTALNGLYHLNSRGTSLVCVSRAPIEKIEAYKKRMGFTFPWVSSHGTSFNEDFQATVPEDTAGAQYNFRPKEYYEEKGMSWATKGEQPGSSCFVIGTEKNGIGEVGKVYHSYSSYARAGEAVLPVLNWLDMTKLGRRDEMAEVEGVGFKRKDEYTKEELRGFESSRLGKLLP